MPGREIQPKSPELLAATFACLFPHARFADLGQDSKLANRTLFLAEKQMVQLWLRDFRENAIHGKQSIRRVTFTSPDRLHLDFYLNLVKPLAKKLDLRFNPMLTDLHKQLEIGENLGGFGIMTIEGNVPIYAIGIENQDQPTGIIWATKGIEPINKPAVIPSHTAVAL